MTKWKFSVSLHFKEKTPADIFFVTLVGRYIINIFDMEELAAWGLQILLLYR